MKIVQRVYSENSPTSRIMENEVLFTNIPKSTLHQKQGKIALAQISNINRQHITNKNRNRLYRLNFLYRLAYISLPAGAADKTPKRDSKDVHSSQHLGVFITFPTGCGVT
ncbi:hypothetical protein AVEN_224754-1 [Araneus ventricosus]|uniref:Uncharacterized protein n=1 Tax=Araneus ventricosus TaxID=182803 RepID=A0A4Y2GVE8_ARAVE|nr:hypothetical protein AVEN_224754-1 [Araneus ventricosus]